MQTSVSFSDLKWLAEMIGIIGTVLIGVFHLGGRIKSLETKLDMLVGVCPRMHLAGSKSSCDEE